MNLNTLYYFRMLGRLEHYRQAAEKLHIAQPSLSHAIASLEKELGTRLFERQGRNALLTKYGNIFWQHIDHAMAEIEMGIKEIQHFTDSNNGKIDLAFTFTLGAHFIPDLLNDFLKQPGNSAVAFSTLQGNSLALIDALKANKCDLALCCAEDETDIEFIPILKQELVVIVPQTHPLAGKESVSLQDTIPYQYIYYGQNSALRRFLDSIFHQIGATPKILCEVEEDTAIAGLVAANFGIAIMQNIKLLKYFSNIKILPIENLPNDHYLYLAYMKNRFLTPTVHRFIDFVVNNLKYKL
jgi:Transcriptional regulator